MSSTKALTMVLTRWRCGLASSGGGILDPAWRDPDGNEVNLEDFGIQICHDRSETQTTAAAAATAASTVAAEKNQPRNCLSWKMRKGSDGHIWSCLRPEICTEKLGFACEVLKIDFDSKMLKKYEKLFGGGLRPDVRTLNGQHSVKSAGRQLWRKEPG